MPRKKAIREHASLLPAAAPELIPDGEVDVSQLDLVQLVASAREFLSAHGDYTRYAKQYGETGSDVTVHLLQRAVRAARCLRSHLETAGFVSGFMGVTSPREIPDAGDALLMMWGAIARLTRDPPCEFHWDVDGGWRVYRGRGTRCGDSVHDALPQRHLRDLLDREAVREIGVANKLLACYLPNRATPAETRTQLLRIKIVDKQVLLDGSPIDLDLTDEALEEVLTYLENLIEHAPNWVTGPEIGRGVRWDRVRKKLPAALACLTETNRRKGNRLLPAAWRK